MHAKHSFVCLNIKKISEALKSLKQGDFLWFYFISPARLGLLIQFIRVRSSYMDV